MATSRPATSWASPPPSSCRSWRRRSCTSPASLTTIPTGSDLLDFKKLPLDAQLTALLDGETTPEQKHELEQRLATDDGARRIYDKLRNGADFGKRRLDDILKEPVPLAL